MEIIKGVKLSSDFMVNLFLENMKRKLETVSPSPYPLKLTVVESRNVDAFATVGGYLYITTGLIELCENEDELAGVLSHEIAHIVKRHAAKRLEKEKYLNIGRIATVLLTMLVGDPKAKEAILTSGMGTIQSISLMYSREDETEADSLGSSVSEKAGYSCEGIADFLKRLRITGRDTGLPQYLLTHPYHEERISKMEIVCKKSETKRDKRDNFFYYIAKRAQIANHQSKRELLNLFLKKYGEDKMDISSAYGASLLLTIFGRKDEAIDILQSIDSQFKNLFLGEILFLSGNLNEAVEKLRNEESIYAKYILARSFEEKRDFDQARYLYTQLLPFADSFPEIFLRLGMVVGRSGNEAKGFEYLGKYYLAIGKESEARMYFEKALSKYGLESEEAKELSSLLKTLKKR
ncbi:MAG: M48 family metalloprotease [Deltaproteobacteria bacterium]|nr:M48 family metalloprotease [Deltaproteobacteria bacterium]